MRSEHGSIGRDGTSRTGGAHGLGRVYMGHGHRNRAWAWSMGIES